MLGETLGVPLFQEQAMRVAIVCAGFTPGEADQLRKSMATFKHTGGVSAFRDKLITGMVANGYEQRFAEQTFKQLEGFRGVAASIREIPPHSDGGEHDRGAWPDFSARARWCIWWRISLPTSAELATVGSRDAAFPLPHGRGDQVTHAGGEPDPRERPPKGLRTRDIYISDLHVDTIKMKSRNFH